MEFFSCNELARHRKGIEGEFFPILVTTNKTNYLLIEFTKKNTFVITAELISRANCKFIYFL